MAPPLLAPPSPPRALRRGWAGGPLLLGAIAMLGGPATHADTVELDTGGRLHGEVAADAADRRRVVVETQYGAIKLQRSRVARIDPESPAEAEYRRRTPTVADNVESQYAHAMWCRDQGLAGESRRHLARVVELDPSHAEARQFLGYQNVDGDWLTREQVLADRGLVRWDGEYRTAQEIELLKRQRAAEQLQLEWRDRLAAWREGLADPATARDAEQRFRELSDPAASQPLADLFNQEPDPIVRRLLADTLGHLGTPAALGALVDAALADADPEVRALAIERLASDPRPGIERPFLTALKSKDNAVVNRAGAALGAFRSPAVIEPLIDALITTHQRRVGPDSGGQQFDINTASGVFNVGGGPKVIRADLRNPAVHAALVQATGVNFSYDKGRWREWLASQQVAEDVDLRRDP
ncbi:HEAT repeat domain-containing protein [Botrimarina sp.]|uniref:HEAT repeat domain-containing protein n=1 Tax=Botrimarina sp. TaxID=2795802 RepID=UPI0032EF5F3A